MAKPARRHEARPRTAPLRTPAGLPRVLSASAAFGGTRPFSKVARGLRLPAFLSYFRRGAPTANPACGARPDGFRGRDTSAAH